MQLLKENYILTFAQIFILLVKPSIGKAEMEGRRGGG